MARPSNPKETRGYKRKIGARIWALREANGLTGEQLAAMLQVHTSAVSKWECGRQYPAPTDILALTGKFPVDFNYLYGGDYQGVRGDVAVHLPPRIAQKLSETEDMA